ncbi:MAG: GspH/FimT family pseudopilin [Methylotetracoccus sp.]
MNNLPKSGFTLIEMMVTVAVAAILMSVGVPSFQQLIQSNRVTTQTNEFVAALNLARSEAIKRGTRITICKSSTSTSCAGSGGWQQGWIIFTDNNNNAAADDGTGSILRVYGALSDVTLTGNTNVASYVSYVASGSTQLTGGGFQAGTLTLCPGSGSAKGRSMVLSRTGRLSLSEYVCP